MLPPNDRGHEEASRAGTQRRPTPPKLTVEQRRAAYEKALKLRQQRALVKRLLAGCYLTLEEAWGLGPVQGMKVIDLLSALPGIGKPSALKILESAGFKHPDKTTVRGTGPRQREALFEILTAKSPR